MLIAPRDIPTVRVFVGRILLPVIFSAVVTFVCFLLMQLLISEQPVPLNTEELKLSADISSFNLREKPTERRRKIERMMPSEPPQAPADDGKIPIEMRSAIIGDLRIRASLAPIVDLEISSMQFAAPISDLTPIRVVHPIYPFKALMREIEGEVLVEFSIGFNGSVNNPRVVSATPEKIFDKAAIRAIQGFLFRAPSLDGVSFEVPVMQLMFYFRLEDELAGVAMTEEKTTLVDDLN